jgi:hypothetical protein
MKRAVCKCDHNKEAVSTSLNTKFPPHFDGQELSIWLGHNPWIWKFDFGFPDLG